MRLIFLKVNRKDDGLSWGHLASALSVSKRKWTEGIYLVTEGNLRMTDRRTLDRGGMSSSDSGVITSSGWVIFKNKSTAAFIIPLIELLENIIAQVPYQAKDMWDIGKRQMLWQVARTFWSKCLFSTMMTAKRVEKTPLRGALSQVWATWRKSVRPGTADWHSWVRAQRGRYS